MKWNINYCTFLIILVLLPLTLSLKGDKKKNEKSQVQGFKCESNFQSDCNFLIKYRNIDGTCNNIENGWWGRADAPYKRWLDPDYADGFSVPRVSIKGLELPSARKVSCLFYGNKKTKNNQINQLFINWGLFTTIDMTNLKKNSQKCSSCTNINQCLPILIDKDLRCSNEIATDCLSFVRSFDFFKDNKECIREQSNSATSFIDGSTIYGVNDESLKILRDEKAKGALKMLSGDNGDLLNIKSGTSLCSKFKNKDICFIAGDDRVNMVPGLSAIVTIFAREHNRISHILSHLNQNWDSDKIFQETRRLVIAIIQHITYNEYLPLLLNQNTLNKFGLTSDTIYEYNPAVDPRISTEYASAAGRYGHSGIKSSYSIRDKNYNLTSSEINLRDTFFNIEPLVKGSFEGLVRGLIADPLMNLNRHISSELTQHLFALPDPITGQPKESDLAAINIQRGREHGIPSYTKFREFCSLSEINTWDDLEKDMLSDSVNILKSLYDDVNDIDLYAAILAENPTPDSLVGPTLNCLIGLQFRDLKFGDRFWYETSDSVVGFSPDQINEIKKVTLSSVLCRNMFDTPFIQEKAFKLNIDEDENPFIDCNEVNDFNWVLWDVSSSRKSQSEAKIKSILKHISELNAS